MTRKEAVALLERYSNYDGMGIPNLAGCKEAMKVAVDALNEAYPELAESEDERMLRIIIKGFENWKGNGNLTFNNTKVDDIIAYLEKQKEFPMPNSTELIEMWDAEKAMLKEKDFRDDAWRLAYNAFMDGFAKGTCVKFEKQKEQKHPNGCFTCDEYKKGYEEGRRNGFTAGYNKAMKEVEQKEQKPAEWSANDKAFIKDCARILDENGYEASAERLLSMFPVKPAEWSEEDEKQIRQIERIVKDAGGSVKLQEQIHNWFKSLRHSWKPSEEQMEALERCIDYMDESDNDDSGIMLTLYEQLKKLM